MDNFDPNLIVARNSKLDVNVREAMESIKVATDLLRELIISKSDVNSEILKAHQYANWAFDHLIKVLQPDLEF